MRQKYVFLVFIFLFFQNILFPQKVNYYKGFFLKLRFEELCGNDCFVVYDYCFFINNIVGNNVKMINLMRKNNEHNNVRNFEELCFTIDEFVRYYVSDKRNINKNQVNKNNMLEIINSPELCLLIFNSKNVEYKSNSDFINRFHSIRDLVLIFNDTRNRVSFKVFFDQTHVIETVVEHKYWGFYQISINENNELHLNYEKRNDRTFWFPIL
jgi:hypothetical protein